MTSSRSLRRGSAWAVPALTIAAVAGIALVPSAASASAHPKLPFLSPAQLLAAVESSAGTPLSGEIVETARLGLPSLPGSDSGTALSWQTLVTGTHTARLWLNGLDQQRLALLGQLSESDVVRHGKDVWTYSSDTNKATHTTLSGKGHVAAGGRVAGKPDSETPGAAALTPLDAATKALAEIDPSTAVSVDRTARVAGQEAYTLVLSPRPHSGSTIRKILIAVDSVHKVPLRVQIFARGEQAAFETAFQNISFNAPARKVFQFTAPTGSTVTGSAPTGPSAASGSPAPKQAEPAPKVVGSGWSSVLVFPASASGASPLAALSGSSLPSGASGRSQRRAQLSLSHLAHRLKDGNQLLSTALVNLLIAQDGRVLVGAVTPSVLEQAAAGKLS